MGRPQLAGPTGCIFGGWNFTRGSGRGGEDSKKGTKVLAFRGPKVVQMVILRTILVMAPLGRIVESVVPVL